MPQLHDHHYESLRLPRQLLAGASAIAVTLFLAQQVIVSDARAQFVCADVTTGDGQGATAAGTTTTNNVACGRDADASGISESINSAFGFSANASGNLSANVAIGGSANGSGNRSFNVATGRTASASGEDSRNITAASAAS